MRQLYLILGLILGFAGVALAQLSGGGSTTPSFLGGAQRSLCSIRAANFNSTADQVCTIASGITVWMPTSIIVTNCSASLTLAVGGVYPTISKGGTALVAGTQIYTALTASTVVLGLTLAANIATTRYTAATIYLALTTAQGTAATCDVYVWGNDLT